MLIGSCGLIVSISPALCVVYKCAPTAHIPIPNPCCAVAHGTPDDTVSH